MLIASASQLDEYTAGFLLVVRTDTAIIGTPRLRLRDSPEGFCIVSGRNPFIIGRFSLPDEAFEFAVFRANLYIINSTVFRVSFDRYFSIADGAYTHSILTLRILIFSQRVRRKGTSPVLFISSRRPSGNSLISYGYRFRKRRSLRYHPA